jgi:hypothetical protein
VNAIDQITYRAPAGSAGIILQAATSIQDPLESEQWQRRLEPWLRGGRPPGRAYLNFGSQAAAFIRWYAEPRNPADWRYAVVLIGPPSVLTARYALELPDLDARTLDVDNRKVAVPATGRGPDRDSVEERARSAGAIEVLVPMLAHVLRDERRVTMPWQEPRLPEAAVWALISILEMVGDIRPVSFLTCASDSNRATDPPGLVVSFRANALPMPPDPGFAELAASIAATFAAGPDQLRQVLAQHGMPDPAEHTSPVVQLISRWPSIQAQAGSGAHRASAPSQPHGRAVMCPFCLHEIADWDALPYWHWDAAQEQYTEVMLPADLNPVQHARHISGAHVRCPASGSDVQGGHYLPVNYGRFGPPVLLGFVGLTKSGKSHLLAAMVGAIEAGDLAQYGIASHPLDHATHRKFLDKWVNPLLSQDKVLPDTREGVVEIADAFLMSVPGGAERPVVLFDIAGGDLAQDGVMREFLWIADGLFFVIDPDHIRSHRAGDETFRNVLDVVRESARPEPVSAAIVLNKADKVRFDDPVARWLRTDGTSAGSAALDPVSFLQESADIYAYLSERRALALAAPYHACDKATLHVASPTGGASSEGEGAVYPRGVTPRRVLRPLVAMLAMTGVLVGPQAARVGI